MTLVQLSLAEEIETRPFASPAHTKRDGDVMRAMLERLRAVSSAWDAGTRSFLVREPDTDGLRHWIRVPDCSALLGARRLTAVGFFGQARAKVDHLPIHDLEAGIVDTLETIAGVLSYYDVALADGGYGNLILCATAEAPAQVRSNELHRRAVALTPRHYRWVRLHTGSLSGPLSSDAPLLIERTRYYDFDDHPPWLAARDFS